MLIAKTKKHFLSSGSKDILVNPKMLTRHMLVAGSTGKGKSCSLKVLIEQLSKEGIPTFFTDVKGDGAGLCKEGVETPVLRGILDELEVKKFNFSGFPVKFWDVLGQQGSRIQTTVSGMGALFLSKMLGLTEAQTRIVNGVFTYAENCNAKIKTLQEFLTVLNLMRLSGNGHVSLTSAGVIQGAVIELQRQGGDNFFGETEFDLTTLIKTERGKGKVNILAANKLMRFPKLYAGFLLWTLDTLYEILPEVGDLEKPKLVVIIDEAKLLFGGLKKNPSLLEKIEQSIRLIRSKGVGIVLSTQSPDDIPKEILGQLGNRIQHGMIACTGDEARAISNMVKTFRKNNSVNVEEAIIEMGIGEALISFLQDGGVPMPVERCNIMPPQSFMGAISEEERQKFY